MIWNYFFTKRHILHIYMKSGNIIKIRNVKSYSYKIEEEMFTSLTINFVTKQFVPNFLMNQIEALVFE